jgi:predicted dithiol-disulfide oxidoreductase (DUF899 family)
VPESPPTLHDVRFPGESDAYRRARDELLQAEIGLRRQMARVAALRRDLPPGGLVSTDYAFDEWDAGTGTARQVRLSELFEPGKDTLLLYSFMVVPAEQGLPFVGPCPSCTSIIDGVDGALPHITERMNFAVAAKPPIEEFREHGRGRGWRNARLLCTAPSELQPRLRRRGRRRQSVADRHRVRPARRQDSPLLEQRAMVGPTRRRTGPSTRGLHVADVGGV